MEIRMKMMVSERSTYSERDGERERCSFVWT